MQDRKLWHMWLVWLLAVCLTMTPVLMAEDDEEEEEETPQGDSVIVQEKASDASAAIAKAWRKAMLKYLDDNMSRDDYVNFQSAIETYISENWKSYVVGDFEKPKVLKRYNKNTRTITIEAIINGAKLLADLKQKCMRTAAKLEGMMIAVLHDDDKYKAQQDEKLDHDTVFDELQNVFGKSGARFVNVNAVQEAKEIERIATGTSAFKNSGATAYDDFNYANVLAKIRIKTTKQEEPTATKTVVSWDANISVVLLWHQTGEEFLRFGRKFNELDSSLFSDRGLSFQSIRMGPNGQFVPGLRETRDRVMKVLAEAVAEEIVKEVANRSKVMKENEYTITFTGFTGKQRDKLEEMLQDLQAGANPKMKIISTYSAGAGQAKYKMLWMRNADSQATIASHIKETCGNNEIPVRTNFQTKGILIFQYAK